MWAIVIEFDWMANENVKRERPKLSLIGDESVIIGEKCPAAV